MTGRGGRRVGYRLDIEKLLLRSKFSDMRTKAGIGRK